MQPGSRVLDIGCGNNKQPGAWGVDLHGDQADVRFDLNLHWPLPANYFYVVYALQVLEHLDDRVHAMEELWRVCRHGALIFVTVPDGLCAGYIQDPTHVSLWNIGTFMYFCPDQFIAGSERPPYEFKAKFQIVHYKTDAAGKTPWGSPLYADTLTVILQAVKDAK